MTHEQAKEIVKRIKGYMDDGECWSESEFMAMDMAIKALEQEPCEDVVSREELLKAIDTWDKFGVDDTNSLFRLDNLSLPHYVPYIHYDDVIKCIKGMPSVTQKSETVTEFADRCRECGKMRKGHWIYDKTIENWRCSKCNETPKTMGYVGTADFMAEHFKFCNHCGACMKDGRTLDEFIEDSKESEE